MECLLSAQRGICRRDEVAQVFSTPLLELVFHAARVHRMYNDPQMVRAASSQRVSCRDTLPFEAVHTWPEPLTLHIEYYNPPPCVLRTPPGTVSAGWGLPQVQRCTLLSIKTGGCPETCTYCAQSTSWSKDVGLKAEKLMGMEEVLEVRGSLFRENCSHSWFMNFIEHAFA